LNRWRDSCKLKQLRSKVDFISFGLKEPLMNFKNILFATDFSHTGDAAFDMATLLARESGALLHIVHTEEPPELYAGEFYYGIEDPNTDQMREMLEAVKPSDDTMQYEHHLITGKPATEIVNFADKNDIDLIVMGTHGRRGLGRLLMGSVSEAVVRRANCPVLTLKEPAKVNAR